MSTNEPGTRESAERSGTATSVAFQFTGQHHLLAYEGCDADLDDLAAVEAALREGIEAAGAQVRGLVSTKFDPHGLSVAFLLAESHATIHTYPEHGAAFLDIFTCGTTCRTERFDAVVRQHLRPRTVRSQLITR